jgi:hypothetical protein
MEQAMSVSYFPAPDARRRRLRDKVEAAVWLNAPAPLLASLLNELVRFIEREGWLLALHEVFQSVGKDPEPDVSSVFGAGAKVLTPDPRDRGAATMLLRWLVNGKGVEKVAETLEKLWEQGVYPEEWMGVYLYGALAQAEYGPAGEECVWGFREGLFRYQTEDWHEIGEKNVALLRAFVRSPGMTLSHARIEEICERSRVYADVSELNGALCRAWGVEKKPIHSVAGAKAYRLDPPF